MGYFCLALMAVIAGIIAFALTLAALGKEPERRAEVAAGVVALGVTLTTVILLYPVIPYFATPA